MLTREQIRAARAWLNLGQQDVADAINVSGQTISDIENERTNPKAAILEKLQSFYEIRGLEFTSDGGIKKSHNLVKIYEGSDCYIRLLDDAHRILANKKGEICFSGSDETRSPPQIIKKFREMRADGIRMRSLIKNGDTFIMGNIDEYRWMDDEIFIDADVKIIFADYVAYLVSWLDTSRVIIIVDPSIAQENKRIFDYIWKNSKTPTHSTAKETYE
jgi:DNA-binding XRE family transcriptional regulator